MLQTIQSSESDSFGILTQERFSAARSGFLLQMQV